MKLNFNHFTTGISIPELLSKKGFGSVRINFFLLVCLMLFLDKNIKAQNFAMPGEHEMHEATWLQWPHQYTYGMFYRNSLDPTWVSMTAALVQSENVNIIAYNNAEKNRVITLLQNNNVDLTRISFFVFPNNDVWVRDNGPIYVRNDQHQLLISDWSFNGWGNDAPYQQCDLIPTLVGSQQNIQVVNVPVVLEGGAIEHDGRGTAIGTRSAITHSSRNPNLSEFEIEEYFRNFLGIQKMIWLDGLYGEEITDMHIDGFLKFVNDSVVLTLNDGDLSYWGVTDADKLILSSISDVNNEPYYIYSLPLTQNDVTTTFGTNLGYKGSYCNYYIANSVVLVPNYNDANDAVANAIIQGFYPDRTVVGIDCRNLYENGGMVHCVTQQQPLASSSSVSLTLPSVTPQVLKTVLDHHEPLRIDGNKTEVFSVQIFDLNGKTIMQRELPNVRSAEVDVSFLSSGMYIVRLNKFYSQKIIVR